MANIKKRRKSVRGVIESTQYPDLESQYKKFTGSPAEDVSLDRGRDYVFGDPEKSDRYWKPYHWAKYFKKNPRQHIDIHTHNIKYKIKDPQDPSFKSSQTIPSYGDIRGFLISPEIKTRVIAERTRDTGEVIGYLIFRKGKAGINKNFKKEDYEDLRKDLWGEKINFDQFNNLIANKTGLKVKYIPLPPNHFKFSKDFLERIDAANSNDERGRISLEYAKNLKKESIARRRYLLEARKYLELEGEENGMSADFHADELGLGPDDSKKAQLYYRMVEKIDKELKGPVKEYSDHNRKYESQRADYFKKQRRKRREREKSLESKVDIEKISAIASVIGIAGGLFFLGFNITGNVIGSQAISNWVGAGLLIGGLIAGFFWLKRRRH